MTAVAAAVSRQGSKCSAAVGGGRCWRLALLTAVALVIGHLLLYLDTRTRSTRPWSILPNSTFQITWFNKAMLGGLEKHSFLETERQKVGANDSILVNATAQRAGGGGNSSGGSDDGGSGGSENGTANTDTPPCPGVPPDLLGRVKVDMNPPSLEEQELAHPELPPGGHYLPKNCTARHRVAIIIPYRDRRSHLTALVHHLHPFLQRQQIEYNIFVVEQAGHDLFNRGMLMNVGFVEALEQYPFDCIILHDVDLVPEDDRNLYTCSEPPRHMSVAISKHGYRLPYGAYFGGVSAMTTAQYRAINGFSNEFWGWGGEDDDLFNRVRYQGLQVSRYPSEMGRYTMLSHQKAKPSSTRHRKLQTGKRRFKTDGLSNLRYQTMKTERRHLFTWMLVALARR